MFLADNTNSHVECNLNEFSLQISTRHVVISTRVGSTTPLQCQLTQLIKASRVATMADHQVEGGVYIYRGGRAPQHITHAIIDKSVKKVDDNAFKDNRDLHTVETHDGLEEIGESAFYRCQSLTRLDLKSVRILRSYSFWGTSLTEVDGDNLEIIEHNVFFENPLRRISFPKVKRIEPSTFEGTAFTDVVLPEVMEFVDVDAFADNANLRRICIPLKPDLFNEYPDFVLHHDTGSFNNCDNLETVELLGGIHETVSSLHMKVWGDDMVYEIDRINTTLPSIPSLLKTNVIRWWLQSVHRRFEHYKAEHNKILKEATVLLELALWTANLNDDERSGEDESLEVPTKKVKIDATVRTRIEQRITSGADIVIKNVLPFLALK